MEFQERIQEGFSLALKEGLNGFNGLSLVLAKIGEQFVHGSRSVKPSASLLHPKVAGRLMRAFVRALLDGRRRLLPKDLWDVKCIATGGTDVALFRERIREYWGKEPIEIYACTEGGLLAPQGWNGKGMTFFPDVCFLEFIPEDEHFRGKEDPTYRPRTVLLDEVEARQRYELVISSFLGGCLVRYRIGDILEVSSIGDSELGVSLPQFVFFTRVGDTIDLSGIARLTERTVWRAIDEADFAYTDWVAVKDYGDGQAFLHLYIETDGDLPVDAIRERIHGNLKRLDPDYADLESVWDSDPLRVTVLPEGSHRQYYETRQREGADLAHLKPPHMNPSAQVLGLLLMPKLKELQFA
jgi:hypothetical protein